MKTLLKIAGACVALFLFAAIVGTIPAAHAAAPFSMGSGLIGLALVGMQIPVRARTLEELNLLSNPSRSGQLEAVPWKYYDTQTVVSTTTTTLSFFGAIQSDKTLGNIETANTIQAPNYFELYAIKCDFLTGLTNAAGAVTGTINDLAVLLNTQRATYEFSINSKSYGKVPLSFAHCSGGPIGFLQGTSAANQVAEFGTNSIPDEGDWWGGVWQNPQTGAQEQCGALVLQPTQAFALTVAFAAAPTLSTNIAIRMSLCGVLHRQVR